MIFQSFYDNENLPVYAMVKSAICLKSLIMALRYLKMRKIEYNLFNKKGKDMKNIKSQTYGSFSSI